jgi:hypothetical protein
MPHAAKLKPSAAAAAMTTFVESPHRQQEENEYPFGKTYPERSDPQWLPYFKAIDRAYDRRSLPRGTIVYRGSLSPRMPKSISEVTFFGLDFRISAWILAEQWVRRLRSGGTIPPYARWVGYVHVFRLNKALPYKYIKEDGCTPLDEPHRKTCERTPCVHAQVVFHEGLRSDNGLVDLGVELTVPPSFYGHLEHVGTHVLDITALLLNRIERPSRWQPQAAIVRSTHNLSFRGAMKET